MLTTTTVSLEGAPVTTTVQNTSYPSHLQHALIIDLKRNPDGNFQENFPSFLNRLQSTTQQPIDMLQFREETPSLEIWEALRGLKSVSHLEMISGYEERCNIEPLDEVGGAWPLQSLRIVDACGEKIQTAHLNTLTSLTLEFCCGLRFDTVHSPEASQLKRLTIIENDACDHFITLQEDTHLLQHLAELTIQSTNGCDFAHQYGTEDFGKALVQCATVQVLDLSLVESIEGSAEEHFLAELPKSFPANLEVLRFRGPPTLANRLSVWRECLSNPAWLPKLKSIRFALDVCSERQAMPAAQLETAREQSLELLKTFVSLRPEVSISEEATN